MPRVSCITFAAKYLTPNIVSGKRMLDVGACDFNGTIRPLMESYNVGEYIGIDLIEDSSVDIVMNADDIVDVFGKESFDIVLSMEMMEHTKDWRKSLSGLKSVCKVGGIIIITSPSVGYPYHGYPDDYWRYEPEDLRDIMSDCEILGLEKDEKGPGSFICVRKPLAFSEYDASKICLHSMVAGKRICELNDSYYGKWHFQKVRVKQILGNTSRSIFLAIGRLITKLLRV